MKTFKSLAIAVGSLCVLPAAAHAKEAQASDSDSASGMAMMRLNAAAVNEGGKQNNVARADPAAQRIYGGSLWTQLRSDFRMREVNPNLVRTHENKFVANSAYFNRTLNRSKPYMFHITNEVRKRGMPAEIALLPFIESAYVTKARSHVGASGLWQFMPATGRHYGLEQTALYDGRHDVYASTNAALNYLQYLHGLFNDWSLALAAYNWGEGNVSRAVRQAQAAGLAPTYENLRMPAETRNYVPKLLAVRNLVNNPQAYGLSLPDIQHSPYFTTVTVDTPLDIMAAAHLANISESEFLSLNPAFKTPVFIPKNGRKMLLPITAAKTFETNYRNTDTRALLSWDVFTPRYNMTISDIASQTNTPVSELRRLNGLNGARVSAGRSLLVSRSNANNKNISVNFAQADIDNTPDTFVEQAPVLTAAPTSYVASAPTPAPAQKQAAFINFVENNAPSIQLDNSATPAVAVRQSFDFKENAKPTVKTNVAVASKQPTTPYPTVDFVAKTQAEANNPAAVENASAVAAASLAAPADLMGSASAPSAMTTNFIASTPEAAEDPLLALANERSRALRNARETVAKVNREEAIREAKEKAAARAAAAKQAEQERAAAKLAETKRQQERLRAERLQQVQQLAAIRQAREAGESVPQAIRTSARPQAQAHNGTHRVQHGDTLYNIAQRYNLNVADLASANNISNNNIRIGQVLRLTSGKKAAPNNGRSGLSKVSLHSNADAISTPVSYTVRKGDTLHSIASRYNLNVNDIKRLNKGSEVLKTGQTIKLMSS